MEIPQVQFLGKVVVVVHDWGNGPGSAEVLCRVRTRFMTYPFGAMTGAGMVLTVQKTLEFPHVLLIDTGVDVAVIMHRQGSSCPFRQLRFLRFVHRLRVWDCHHFEWWRGAATLAAISP